MSFIGSLDQFDLSIILQKIEEYRKTGVLIVRQDETVVELSFQHGQLVCVGPIKPGITIGTRLLQTGVISADACHAIEFALGARRDNENDAVQAFINAQHLDRDGIIRWAEDEASLVLDAILAWENGDLYFEEDQLPPTHRYQVPLSIAALLSATPPPSPARDTPCPPEIPVAVQAPPNQSLASPAFSAASLIVDDAFTSRNERHTDALPPAMMAVEQPQRVTDPLPPVRINPAQIQPNTTLKPVDLSAYRDSNAQVLLTPEQWRLFTRANGETTLSIAAQELRMTPDQVCRVACELLELGLVTMLPPAFSAHPGAHPAMGDNVEAFGGLRPADVQMISYQPARQPIETLSQWGNGGNGATFQLGSGWVVSQATSPYAQQAEPEHNRALAQAS